MYSLLLVDDEPIVLKGLQSLPCWDEFGFEKISTAATVAEACTILNTEPPDVMIVDIRMRGESGLSVLQYARENNLRTKSVILSGYSNFDYIKAALNYGIENYLTKPIDEDELRQTLSQIIEKIESEASNSYYTHVSKSVMLENTLEMWIKGMLNADNLMERLSFYGLDAEYGYYCTGMICHARTEPINAGEVMNRKEVVEQIIKKYKTDRGRIISIWTTDDNLVFVCCSWSPIDQSDMEKTAEEIASWCQEMIGGDWFPIIGHQVDHISKIFESYLVCRNQQNELQGSKKIHPVVKDLINKINENYAVEYSLKLLADQYGLSQAYLGRLFKIGTGKLFTNYLRDIRLEAAKRLLLESDKRTSEIAEEIGFQNANYFSNVFMQHVGMYPSAYRKAHQRLICSNEDNNGNQSE